jgi:hypothetical protein
MRMLHLGESHVGGCTNVHITARKMHAELAGRCYLLSARAVATAGSRSGVGSDAVRMFERLTAVLGRSAPSPRISAGFAAPPLGQRQPGAAFASLPRLGADVGRPRDHYAAPRRPVLVGHRRPQDSNCGSPASRARSVGPRLSSTIGEMGSICGEHGLGEQIKLAAVGVWPIVSLVKTSETSVNVLTSLMHQRIVDQLVLTLGAANICPAHSREVAVAGSLARWGWIVAVVANHLSSNDPKRNCAVRRSSRRFLPVESSGGRSAWRAKCLRH